MANAAQPSFTPATARDPVDELLFAALKRGDSQAMTEIVARQGRWVGALIYGVMGHRRDLDDILQQVWLNVWRHAGTLETPAHWRTWLYRLARNTAIDAGRRQTRRKGLWRRLSELIQGEPVEEGNAQQRLETAEAHRAALAAIEALPPIYREPFVLRHLEDWTYKQIAEALGLPLNTVEIRLVRARRRLRAALESMGGASDGGHRKDGPDASPPEPA